MTDEQCTFELEALVAGAVGVGGAIVSARAPAALPPAAPASGRRRGPAEVLRRR